MTKKKASMTKADYELLSEFRYQLRRFMRFSEDAVQAEGMTPLQYQLLLQLKGFPGREWATVGELAERLQAQHHGVVALVTRCEGAGPRAASSRLGRSSAGRSSPYQGWRSTHFAPCSTSPHRIAVVVECLHCRTPLSVQRQESDMTSRAIADQALACNIGRGRYGTQDRGLSPGRRSGLGCAARVRPQPACSPQPAVDQSSVGRHAGRSRKRSRASS